MRVFASAIDVNPFKLTDSFAESMYSPSPVNASGHVLQSLLGAMPCCSNQEAGGMAVAVMGKLYVRANSKSRWSPLGTAMMAPVP